MNCLNCGIEFEGKKEAKFCSPKCRLQAFRRSSIETDNVAFQEHNETDNFKFTVTDNRKPGDDGYDDEMAKSRKQVREEKYWYNVPLGAVPVKQKGWPDMPEFMNGRQYFLWWKNGFQVDDNGQPVILNPYPDRTGARVELGGEGSRRWGA